MILEVRELIKTSNTYIIKIILIKRIDNVIKLVDNFYIIHINL